ncbi:hypothetical protein E4H12_12895 [Candidatus Thorarchaeota archaeon]|nr:MAG: hypothetical protein E4H12_12895 [Candidatus Thorarchaeota archaeon]HUW47661.1 hypothetical protein [Patescibacteria group bacterium]
MSDTKVVVIGYWRSRLFNGERELFQAQDEHLPWPVADKLNDMEVQSALQALDVLENRIDIKIESFRGVSQCRICGCMNGCQEFVLKVGDVEYRWPEGLKHYIEKHKVALPEGVKDILSNMMIIGLRERQAAEKAAWEPAPARQVVAAYIPTEHSKEFSSDVVQKVIEARNALTCLYIATDRHIAEDVNTRVEAAFNALQHPEVCTTWCGKEHCKPPNYCFHKENWRKV